MGNRGAKSGAVSVRATEKAMMTGWEIEKCQDYFQAPPPQKNSEKAS